MDHLHYNFISLLKPDRIIHSFFVLGQIGAFVTLTSMGLRNFSYKKGKMKRILVIHEVIKMNDAIVQMTYICM